MRLTQTVMPYLPPGPGWHAGWGSLVGARAVAVFSPLPSAEVAAIVPRPAVGLNGAIALSMVDCPGLLFLLMVALALPWDLWHDQSCGKV